MNILDTLNAKQQTYVRTFARVVHDEGLPIRALVIVLETALVESGLKVYANSNVPDSLNYQHDAIGDDHLSVGIFQQQVPSWGTTRDCMDPEQSCRKFLARLQSFDWLSMRTGDAAQRVQVSAFPLRYQQQEATATQLAASVWSEVDMTKEQEAKLDDALRLLRLVINGDAPGTPTDKRHDIESLTALRRDVAAIKTHLGI